MDTTATCWLSRNYIECLLQLCASISWLLLTFEMMHSNNVVITSRGGPSLGWIHWIHKLFRQDLGESWGTGRVSLIEAQHVYQTHLIKFALYCILSQRPSLLLANSQFWILNPGIIERVWVNPGQIVIIYRHWSWSLLYSLLLIRTQSLLLRPAIELSRRKFKNSNVAQPLARFMESRK